MKDGALTKRRCIDFVDIGYPIMSKEGRNRHQSSEHLQIAQQSDMEIALDLRSLQQVLGIIPGCNVLLQALVNTGSRGPNVKVSQILIPQLKYCYCLRCLILCSRRQ